MRIGRKSSTSDLLTEIVDVLIAQAAFKPSTSVDSRRGVSLPIDVIAPAIAIFSSIEVVQSNFPEVRCRCIGGDVAADTIDVFVGPSDHHHRIPAVDGVKALFHLKIAWIGTLHVGSDGVQIRCCRRIDVDTRISTGCNRTVEQSLCTLSTLLFDDFLD